MLSYNAPSKSHAIVENAGGILRNISSHIAVREDYRYVSVKWWNPAVSRAESMISSNEYLTHTRSGSLRNFMHLKHKPLI
jgi:hypothetical protein